VTGLLWVKLRRDARASWSRFALMVVALSVCLSVFGATLYAWAGVGRETTGAYLGTQPASATIVLDGAVDPERMAALVAAARTRPGVIEATGRTQFDSTVAVNGQPRAIPLQVFVAAPDDPMRMVRFDYRADGVWPPEPGSIYIGRDGSLGLLGASVGDTVTVTTPAGTVLPLRVAGTVYDPSLAPSFQEQRGHGYVSTASLAAAGPPAGLDQLKIQVSGPDGATPSRDRDAIVAVASDVGGWLRQRYGLGITEIQVPNPYAHPHQWQSDVLLLSLLAGASAALVLAALLVATMLNNLFTQQIPQIGIMKAVGARWAPVGALYLSMTTLVAATATALAIGPVGLIGRYGVERLLDILGIEPASLAAPWWIYLVVVGVGLGLPVLLALLPLLRAVRTTVRAAMDHHGGTTTPSRVTSRLARLRRLPGADRGVLMALRNTARRPARFWLAVGLLAGAGTVFVAGLSLRSGTQALDQQRTAQRYWDVEAQLDAPTTPDAVVSALRPLAGVVRVETWFRAPIGVAGPGRLPVTRTYPDQGHGSITVNTVPANMARPAVPVVAGRWLRPGETGAVVLDRSTRRNTVPDVGVGDPVQLYVDGAPTTWRVVGIVGDRDAGGLGAYVTAEGLARATASPVRVNQVRVVTDHHDEVTRQSVADGVGRALTGAGMDVGLASSVTRGSVAGSEHLGPVLLVLLGVALPLGVIGFIGLAAMMGANVLDRTREFGVMHAIGARPKAVRRIVVAEGLFLVLASYVVAVLPTLGLTKVLGTGLGNLFGGTPLPFRISSLAVALWVALALFGAVLATEAAAARASRLTVRESLSYL